VPSLHKFASILELLSAACEQPRGRAAIALLDGASASHLAETVSLATRQSLGAYFTGSKLAIRALERFDGNSRVTDPACGGGDLLIAAAKRMPLESTAEKTLRSWGKQLVGRDLVPEFVQTTRLRLALLAAQRTGDSLDLRVVADALPEITVGDGIRLMKSARITGWLVLNPPYGQQEAPADHAWMRGKIARASFFTETAVAALAHGARFSAVLPDVLRSGTRYSRLRVWLASELRSARISVIGRFDPGTDVDVFLVEGTRRAKPNPTADIDWGTGSAKRRGYRSVSSDFDVHVGQVVEYRDKGDAAKRAFLSSGTVKPWTVQHRLADSWGAGARSVVPPFVAIQRTSSPDDPKRVIATVIAGRRPVAVENHLITVRPRSGDLGHAIALMNWLQTGAADGQLQRRIRCRHLTVPAIAGLQWPGAGDTT